jgi:hypothetical protein
MRGVNEVKQITIHKTESVIPKPPVFLVEMTTETLKGTEAPSSYNNQAEFLQA